MDFLLFVFSTTYASKLVGISHCKLYKNICVFLFQILEKLPTKIQQMPKVSIGSKKQIAKVWESNIRQLLQVVFRKLSLQIYRVNAFLLSLYLRTHNFQTIDVEVQKILLLYLLQMHLIHH